MAKLEHIGIAVTDPIPVSDLLSRLLGLECYKVETVPSEGVRTHFLAAGRTKIELLQTDDSDSVIGKFLGKRGEGIHHLAFEVEDLDSVLRRAGELGLAPIGPGLRDGADGKRVFFFHPRDTHGMLIEVCRSDRFPGSRHTAPMPHGALAAFAVGRQGSPPVLLLHDAGSSSLRDFESLMVRLEPYAHVMAFDAPGHGESSDRSPTSHFLRAADKHARAILDYFGIASAMVVGVGLGAAAAAALGASCPDRVRALVLLDPNLLESEDDVALAAEAVRAACGDTNNELASSLISSLPAAREAAVPVARLGTLDCPILLCGVGTALQPSVLRLHDALPKSTVALLPQFANRDALLTRILLGFLDSLSK